MLIQRTKQNKNIPKQGIEKGDKSMLYRAIEILKKEKQMILSDRDIDRKEHIKEKAQLKSQIQYHKKKIIELTQESIVHGLVANKSVNQYKQSESNQYAGKTIKLELQHCKAIIKDKDRQIAKFNKVNEELNNKIRMVMKEKQKNMQITLIEKITHEQRIQLLEKEVAGKKRIIEGLKNQIDRITGLEKQVLKEKQALIKRGKEMQRFEQEFQSYYQQNQKRYKRKIEAIDNQNKFLRKQFKKVVKQVKNSCKCDGQVDQWKQKLYLIGKQLAQARVKLEKNDLMNGTKTNQKRKSPKDLKDSQMSLGSLTLSEDSSSDEKYN